MALQAGDPAPEIQLETDEGEWFTLSSLEGRRTILYFFPKADTPGCTTEACSFRDASAQLAAHDAVVLGISPDPPSRQSKFKAKYSLPFTLLSDVDHAAAEAYGVWKEKSLYGRKFMGVERTTFVIGSDGRIEKIFSKVRPAGHAGEVLASLA